MIPGGKPVESGFIYSSETNKEWLSVDEIKERLLTDISIHD